MRRVLTSLGVAGLLIAALALFWRWNTRATVVQVADELPEGFPAQGFSHEAFELLLQRFVREGRVDYASWHADDTARARLDRYLAAVARYSPDNTPERFAGKHDRLAYWMYAYNAFVIKAVLDRWPLRSVTDVKAPVEAVKGLGFFYTLEFIAGGERTTLYRLEHDKVLKPAQDPRVHFVLNCGSGGCPLMRPELPTGEALEPFLAQATEEFVAAPRNVRIDHANKRITLSKIFEWYESDFLDELRRRGRPTGRGVIDYVAMVAPEPLAAALERARGYRVVFQDYDWALNDTEARR
jgi:hypothetical protein